LNEGILEKYQKVRRQVLGAGPVVTMSHELLHKKCTLND